MKPIPLIFKQAEMVRKAINRLNTSTEIMRACSFGCFDNCREQGFVLHIGWSFANIAFAENRNSDDIVVYCYTDAQFPNNLPVEGQWGDKMYFNHKDYDGAAAYILERAKAYLLEEKREQLAREASSNN